jgi:hypothetical protein
MTTKIRARRAMLFFAGVGIAIASSTGAHEEGDGLLTAGHQYMAILNAGQVVSDPLPESNASGMAFLTFSPKERELCYTVTFSGLVSAQREAPMGAHVHGPATPGANNHNHVAELPSGSPVNGCTVLEKAHVKWLKSNALYLQIHTEMYPAGELRGQIVRVK